MLLFVLKEADGIFRRMLSGAGGGDDEPAGDKGGGGKGGGSKKGAAAGGGGGKGAAATKAYDTTADVLKSPRWRKVALLAKRWVVQVVYVSASVSSCDCVGRGVQSIEGRALALLIKKPVCNFPALQTALCTHCSVHIHTTHTTHTTRSFLGNSLHLLSASTESAMLAFVLRRLRASAPFYGPFAKIQRRTLRAALGIFGSADSAPRVQVRLLLIICGRLRHSASSAAALAARQACRHVPLDSNSSTWGPCCWLLP